ncbi:hypothetical protein BH10PSE5_BH10PSE5_14050 [soil metagenome]
MRTAILAAILSLAGGPALAADPAEGEWLTQDGGGKAVLAPCASRPRQLCGHTSWLRDPAARGSRDANNPDPALKSRSRLGLPLLWGFERAAPGRWTGGKIYDPNSGKTYDGKITATARGTLAVEGCVLMLCRAQTWRRG